MICNNYFFRDGSTKVVVLLVLLVWWLDIPKHHDYQVVEYFAGVGRIAALAKLCGFTTAAVDIDYSRELGKRMGRRAPMDLNGNAGLVFQVCNCLIVLYIIIPLYIIPFCFHHNHCKQFVG